MCLRFGRKLLFVLAVIAVAGMASAVMLPVTTFAEELCAVKHPFMPPDKEFTGQCPNCGMVRPMWARTWMEFTTSKGKFGVCSFHCLADMALKSGEEPKDVMVALYLNPKETVKAKEAFFVVGSKAKGTMTMKSKLSFPSKEEANKFVKTCGGEVVGFKEALKLAKAGVAQENKVIAINRAKAGKTVEPVDNKDSCSVCAMYPTRYPKHKCQVMTKDKKVYHFCSTQCLFSFLADPKEYAKSDVKPFLIWVTDYPTGAWISARTAYYGVGSKARGPMGPEAFAFDKKQAADAFSVNEGGTVLVFSEVSSDRIKLKSK
jgi:nitrous oxide reductase accessory protein NosL